MNIKHGGLCLLILIVMSVLSTAVMPALVTAQDGKLIQYDQVVAGEITNVTPEIHYSFEGSAGDTIIVSMSNTDTEEFYLDSHLELLGPDDQSLHTAGDFSWQWANPLKLQLGPVPLLLRGNYTIIVTRPMQTEGDSSGRFELVVQRVEVNPLTVSETIIAEINNEIPSVFSFSGGSSDIYTLIGDKLEGVGSFSFELRDPYGAPTFTSQDFGRNQDQYVLDGLRMPEAGDYLIVVKREVFFNQQGEPETPVDVLRVALTLQPVETLPIALDTSVTGTLNDENPAVYYTFTGSQGDRLRLTGSQPPNQVPVWVMVIPPTGSFIAAPETTWVQDHFVADPLVFTISGEYVLLIRRTWGTPDGLMGELGEAQYTITLSDSQVPILEAGTEISSAVESSDGQVYRYDGVAGQTLRITLHSLGENFWPYLALESPTEVDLGRTPLLSLYSTLPATISSEVTLPVTGSYLLRVNNMYGGSETFVTGEFRLLVEVVE